MGELTKWAILKSDILKRLVQIMPRDFVYYCFIRVVECNPVDEQRNIESITVLETIQHWKAA